MQKADVTIGKRISMVLSASGKGLRTFLASWLPFEFQNSLRMKYGRIHMTLFEMQGPLYVAVLHSSCFCGF